MQGVSARTGRLDIAKRDIEGVAEAATLPFSHFLDQSIVVVERTLSCWSKLDGRPRLIIKRDGSLVACSESARRILRNSECLTLKRSRIEISHDRDGSKFARIISATPSEAMTLLLRNGEQQEHLIVRAISLEADLICISLQRANSDHYVRLPDLGVAFRLTQSEARIVADLYNGMSPQEIAEQNDISIHTVRAHLRRCYDKLNITSREQLWHRLSAYQM
jgi:DNA-binding CsgD family transcriptional regulator